MKIKTWPNMKYKIEVETTCLWVRLREDDIIETRYKPTWNSREELWHAEENVQAIATLTGSTLRNTISFLPSTPMSKEARQYYGSIKPLALKSALIAENNIQVLVGNFLMTFNQFKIPVRMFKDEGKALNWLTNGA